MAGAVDPDRPVYRFGDGELTVGALQEASRRIGGALAADDTPVLVFAAPNSLAFPVAVFAASAAGIPLVPVNYRLADDRQDDILDRHPGALVVADEPRLAALRDAGRTALSPDQFLALGPGAAPVDLPEPDPDDVAVLLYTSGTTSEPKAVVLRHRHLTSYVLGTVEYASAGPTDAALVAVPPYHIAGVAHVLTNLYSGRRVIYLDAFDAKDWLRLVEEQQVTHAMVVPTMLARIVECLEDTGEPAPSSLRSIVYGGAAMPRRVLEAALRLFPDVGFVNAYGLTETASTIALLGPDDHRRALDGDPAARERLRSAGRPVPGIEIEIRSSDGDPVGPGHEGEIHVRGAQVSGEYVGTSDPTAGGGWFATRDTGYLDDEGYLFILGRFDDTIIRGGENIAPVEIEEVIASHPGVADVAVVGVDDDEWGQRIAAVIVTADDVSLTDEDVRAWVRSRVRGSRTPDQVDFRPSLPYTETGKLLRRSLRQELEDADAGTRT
jgi:acyl-CoA synthetase (AMP-forming)/AMP-acid ligase II